MDDQQDEQQQDMTTGIPVPDEALDADAVGTEMHDGETADGEMPDSETIDSEPVEANETANDSDEPRRSGRLRAAAPYVLAGAVGLAAGAGVVGLVHGLDGDGHDGRSADHVQMGGRDGHHQRGDFQQGDRQVPGGFVQPGDHGPMQGRSGGS